MKNIVVLADFCGSLDGTFNSRFLYLADMLAEEHNVELITSDFDHGKKSYINHEIEKHRFSITLLHEGSYKKNVSIKRFFAHIVWGLNVNKYLKTRTIPDVIYCAVPTLFAAYIAAKFCKINKIKFIVDIQDLWPEAFKMVLPNPFIGSILFFPLTLMADYIYREADAICGVSETYCQRALKHNKQCKEATTVYLGTDLSLFDRYASHMPILNKAEGDIWIAYCGTLGASYNITFVLEALSKIKESVTFIVMGDGPLRKEFELYAKEKNVNAVFTGNLAYSDMCALLKACDITVNPIKSGSAASIINKHADYAASGLPVVNTQESQEYRDLVTDWNMGINCDNEDLMSIVEAFTNLMYDETFRNKLGYNARKCAEALFDRKHTYLRLKELCE